jgi:hypothetical protein
MTALPATELTVVDAPTVIPPAPPASGSEAYKSRDHGELHVLLRDGRLEIAATVDLEGLQNLKEVLTHYEKILVLVAPKQK